MNKDFTKHNQALALKELGFDETCLTYYNYDKRIERSDDWAYGCTLIDKRDRNQCLAPLYQQAFRWFREKHGLIGQPIPLSISYPGKVTHYGWSIVSNQNSNDWENENDRFKSYEEAESACLDKLIEIIKNK